jgi:hypothetical protein
MRFESFAGRENSPLHVWFYFNRGLDYQILSKSTDNRWFLLKRPFRLMK